MDQIPYIPGPQLKQFDTKGKELDIEFVRHLGTGEHGHVWKANINGKPYALKMFRFNNCFTPSTFFHVPLDDDDQFKYMHPFHCESRAYARLHETGQEHIAVACYGYLVLKERHIAALREKDLEHDWERDWGFYGKFTRRPFMALVKEYLEITDVARNDPWPDANLRRIVRAIDSPKTARKLIKSLKALHRIGILNRDINNSNITKGLFLDFSTAWTTPHPCLETRQIEAARDPYDQLGLTDAYDVDDLIDQWNKCHPFSKRIWDRACPDRHYVSRLRLHDPKNPARPDDGLNPFYRGYSLRPDKYRMKDYKSAAKTAKHIPKAGGIKNKTKL